MKVYGKKGFTITSVLVIDEKKKQLDSFDG